MNQTVHDFNPGKVAAYADSVPQCLQLLYITRFFPRPPLFAPQQTTEARDLVCQKCTSSAASRRCRESRQFPDHGRVHDEGEINEEKQTIITASRAPG